MIDHPVRLSIEECTWRMNIHCRIVYNCLVTFLRILICQKNRRVTLHKIKKYELVGVWISRVTTKGLTWPWILQTTYPSVLYVSDHWYVTIFTFLAAFLKNPEHIAFCTLDTFLLQDTTSSLCLSMIPNICFLTSWALQENDHINKVMTSDYNILLVHTVLCAKCRVGYNYYAA
jgi:hypothetical protein